jgi:hypothetical protein
MNATILMRAGRDCLGALLALSSLMLIDADSAIAQGANSTPSQARPDSPVQVSPTAKNQQQSNTSTFTPAKPGSQPVPATTSKAKSEK